VLRGITIGGGPGAGAGAEAGTKLFGVNTGALADIGVKALALGLSLERNEGRAGGAVVVLAGAVGAAVAGVLADVAVDGVVVVVVVVVVAGGFAAAGVGAGVVEEAGAGAGADGEVAGAEPGGVATGDPGAEPEEGLKDIENCLNPSVTA
jgi:hypothetical protein